VAGLEDGEDAVNSKKATWHEPGVNRAEELRDHAAGKRKGSDAQGPRGAGVCACRGPKHAAKMLFIPVNLLSSWLKKCSFLSP